MTERQSRAIDVAVAVASAVGLTLDATGRHHPLVGSALLSVVATVPLLWRRRLPVATFVAVWTALIITVLIDHAYDAATAVALVPLYTLGVSGTRRRSLLAGALGAVILVAATGLVSRELISAGSAARVLLALGAVMTGDLVRVRRELRAAQRERDAQAARERDEFNRRRAAGERLAIARELHDTLAHALVAINVRAGVSALIGGREDTTAALEEIKTVSADALRDLRVTLDVLRDRDAPAPTTPTLDLDAIPDLMQTARSAGLQTVTDVQLDGTRIPVAVGQAGYRIVQESLTNVVRHAEASQTRVTIAVRDGRLHIEVTDDGGTATAAVLAYAGGHGIQGMLERAGALGGTVNAGPLAGRGWRVSATLPLAERS